MNQKWITKDSLDRVSGPFETSEVIRRIHQGLITEDDFIATYPEGRWISVTKNKNFFDAMLDALSNSAGKAKKTPQQLERTSVKKKDEQHGDTETLKLNNTVNKTQLGSDTSESIEKTENNFIDGVKKEKVEPIKPESISGIGSLNKIKKNSAQLRSNPIFDQKEILDLKKHKQLTRVQKYKKQLSFSLLLLSMLSCAYILWPETKSKIEKDLFQLIAPRFGKQLIPKDLESKKLQLAYKNVRKSGFSNFRDAQNSLVQVLESNSSNGEALSLLCFTYYHLWDFTEKKSKDLFAVNLVTKRAVKIDRFGEQGKICKFTDFMVRAKYQEAQKVVDDVLDSEQGAASVTFSYFNGILKFAKRDFVSAEAYYSAAIARSKKLSNQKQSNEFAMMWLSLADTQIKLGKGNKAYQSVLMALRINPENIDALLLKGIIEYRSQRREKISKSTIQKAFVFMDKDDKANKKKLSEAYLCLAEIALKEQRKKSALKYAIAAYNYNPGNSVAKNLSIELGGNRRVGKRTVLSQQLVIEGEQNLQESGCASALALFKEAFKLDTKNGYAALKTAQCLWDLSFAMDALVWIEKAIQADSTLIEAYVTAAKFYVERYDFDSALKVLIKGKNVAPRSYEIYRGLARLEMKRENPQVAIEYGKRALMLYDADTETLILMAKANSDLGRKDQAFQFILRASENDSRNADVHNMYGKIIYKTQGISSAIRYMQNIINSFPLESSYRVTLAEIYLDDVKLGEAETLAREALQFDDKSKAAYMVLGKSLKTRNKKIDALRYFLDAYSLDPSDAEPLFEAGQLYISIAQFEDAIKQFNRVLTMNKKYPRIYYNLAQVYFAQGKMDEAINNCESELKNYPQNDDCHILMAEAFYFKAKFEKEKLSALSSRPITSENSVTLERDKDRTYNQMIGHYNSCSLNYQKAIDIANQPAKIFIDLSRCYRFAGDLDLAQKIVEKALEIEKGNPEVWRENGLIFEQKGEDALALEAYKQYLIISPSAKDRKSIINRMKALEAKITK